MSTIEIVKRGGQDKNGSYVSICAHNNDPLLYLHDIALMWIDFEGAQFPLVLVPGHYKTLDLSPIKRVKIIGVDAI